MSINNNDVLVYGNVCKLSTTDRLRRGKMFIEQSSSQIWQLGEQRSRQNSGDGKKIRFMPI